MRDPERVLNSLAQQSKISMYRFERLYRILFNKEIYYVAYQKLYAKEGNMTPGVDGKTIDDMSIFRIEQLIELLKSEQLQSPNQKIPDRKTKCVIKTHINIKQNVIFGAKLKPV